MTQKGKHRWGTAWVVAAALIVVSLVVGGHALAEQPPDAAPSASPTAWHPTTAARPAPPESSPSGGSATVADVVATLNTIPVKGRAPKTGYSASGSFWGMWQSQDGCRTRNRILARDLTDVTYRSPASCVVNTGVLRDPYTGATIDFQYGTAPGQSDAVQIDHVVARANAWVTGAFQWTPAQRSAFANDPLELLAVGGTVNQQKGSGDAATWLPPNKSFRCRYVTIQVAVKAKYGLWMTQAERDAIAGILAKC